MSLSETTETVVSSSAAAGETVAFDKLASRQKRFIQNQAKFESGDLAPSSSDQTADYASLKAVWNNYNEAIDSLIGTRESVTTVSEYVTQVDESLPELLILSNTLIDQLVKARAPRDHIVIAARQLILIRSMKQSLIRIFGDSSTPTEAVDQLSADAEQVEVNLIAMLEGDGSRGTSKFTGDGVADTLLQFTDLYSVVRKNTREILSRVPEIFKTHQAAGKIEKIGPQVLKVTGALVKAIERADMENRVKVPVFPEQGAHAS